MTFQRLMGIAKRRCLVVFVILICASLATCFKGHEEEELILSQLADPITGDINIEMVSNYVYDMILFSFIYLKPCSLTVLFRFKASFA